MIIERDVHRKVLASCESAPIGLKPGRSNRYSFLVHLYSSEYMSHDPHIARFMSYLSLFTFFMLILVSADNFLQMFVGWEGVGLCSYLLISFWFTRIQANKAAIKAMILNVWCLKNYIRNSLKNKYKTVFIVVY